MQWVCINRVTGLLKSRFLNLCRWGVVSRRYNAKNPMNIYRRSLFAWIAMLGIIFSQLAVSVYACPVLNPANASAQMHLAHEMSGIQCDDMDMTMALDMESDAGPSALCVQHCDQGNQTVGSALSPDFQPALFLVLIVPPLHLAEIAGETYVQASLLARITSPPPLWHRSRLRI